MNTHAFRDMLKSHLRAAGFTQKRLAHALGLHPNVLSHKLHESDGMQLTYAEVKQIIKLLAAQGVIYDRAQAVELLALAEMTEAAFSEGEWGSEPLNKLTADAPPSPPPPAAPTYDALPNPPTPLIGRDALLARLYQRLSSSDIRLLSLIGPGGVGKTRLAIALARQLAPTFRDGAVFVPLADIDDAGLVASSIARKLRLRDTQRDTAHLLKTQLAERQLLLVLDNFEHVLEAAALVSELLDAAPAIKIIATSRAVLNRYGEYQVVVPPLPLPNDVDYEALALSPAIALFAARAEAVRADFRLTPENAPTIAQICQRVDGLPLAIELAAARSRLFAPAALLERLTLPLLTSRDEGLPTRQRAMLHAIGWSYQLLTPEERAAFLNAALFPAGCTVEAAEALVGAGAVDTLTSLLDKSLLQEREGGDGQVRFHMLQTVRDFAQEQWQDDALANARRVQTAYYVALVESAAAGLTGEHQLRLLNRLEAEHDNLRAILAWSADAKRDSAVALVSALAQFWSMRGYAAEGLRWAARVFDGAAPPQDEARKLIYAKALNGCGALAFFLGDYALADTYLQAALRVRLEIEDEEGLASTYNNLGNLAWNRSDFAAARTYFESAAQMAEAIHKLPLLASILNNLGTLLPTLNALDLAEQYLVRALGIWRELGNKQSIANTLSNLGGVMAARQHFDSAITHYVESLTLLREVGNKRNQGAVLSNMGDVALKQGSFDKARDLFEQSQTLQREVDYLWGIASGICDLGRAAFHLGDNGTALARLQEGLTLMRQLDDDTKIALACKYLGTVMRQMNDLTQAQSYYQEALALYRTLEDTDGIATVLSGWAALLVQHGDRQNALHLWGFAHCLWLDAGMTLLADAHAHFSDVLDYVRASLPQSEFDAAWAAGARMSMADALGMINS